jgi:hypothetical protein
MKNKESKKFITKKRAAIAGVCALAIVLVSGGVTFIQTRNAILNATYVDPISESELNAEDTPLAGTAKVTKKTQKKTKTSKKTVTMKTAASKTYTKNLPATKKTTTDTKATDKNTTVKTDTTVQTNVTEKYTKKSKKKTVTTKTVTTVTTTTTVKPDETPKSTPKAAYEVSVTNLAPKMDSRVTSAFQTLGLKVVVDGSVSYSGFFSAKDKKITMREESDTIYHELGHFLAFLAGNYDTGSKFQQIYAAEKGKYSGYNTAYVTQNSAEYFAESVRDYVLNPGALKSARPQTYDAVEEALKKVTTAQVTKMKLVMSAL